jgi:hypothetical protein
VGTPLDMAPALDADDLARHSWAHTTRTVQVFGHRFAVRSTNAAVGRYIGEMYGGCETSVEPPRTWYSVVEVRRDRWPYALYVDEDRATQSERAAAVMNHLTWHVNQRVIESSDEVVLLHAAAASLDGRGVLLPAAMEAGKSTLVAGLVRCGFQYLTDEAAAIDPISLRLRPYAKPLSLDPGSWPVLPDLEPDVDPSTAMYLADQWQVDPRRIRPDAVAGPTAVSVVVFPRYQRGAATQLTALPRSTALVEALEQTFRFHDHGRRNFTVLARLLEQVRCYRLVSGDLDRACAEVTRVVRMGQDPIARTGGRR